MRLVLRHLNWRSTSGAAGAGSGARTAAGAQTRTAAGSSADPLGIFLELEDRTDVEEGAGSGATASEEGAASGAAASAGEGSAADAAGAAVSAGAGTAAAGAATPAGAGAAAGTAAGAGALQAGYELSLLTRLTIPAALADMSPQQLVLAAFLENCCDDYAARGTLAAFEAELVRRVSALDAEMEERRVAVEARVAASNRERDDRLRAFLERTRPSSDEGAGKRQRK